MKSHPIILPSLSGQTSIAYEPMVSALSDERLGARNWTFQGMTECWAIYDDSDGYLGIVKVLPEGLVGACSFKKDLPRLRGLLNNYADRLAATVVGEPIKSNDLQNN